MTVPDDTMDVTHVIIAHEALPASHHDQLCMGILQGMFGSWEKRFFLFFFLFLFVLFCLFVFICFVCLFIYFFIY